MKKCDCLKLENVSSRFGAPMGRPNILPHDLNNPKTYPVALYIKPLRMVDGDYDEGGAYWGGPVDAGFMLVAWSPASDHRYQIFVRAKDRAEAEQAVLKILPFATFMA
jgi:hypothetical protein